jgi:PadR family transcriptional regulator, regulatory protein AphA
MDLSTICLGLLHEQPMTGYALQRRVASALGHFQHASLGALYPALGKLEAGEFVTSSRTGSEGLGKRMYAVTAKGRHIFDSRLGEASSVENFRSSFLSAMYFADRLPTDEIERLIDERLADHRAERRRLLALPISAMSEGQRFTIRYVLAMRSAAIDFLHGEGRAIAAVIQRARY